MPKKKNHFFISKQIIQPFHAPAFKPWCTETWNYTRFVDTDFHVLGAACRTKTSDVVRFLSHRQAACFFRDSVFCLYLECSLGQGQETVMINRKKIKITDKKQRRKYSQMRNNCKYVWLLKTQLNSWWWVRMWFKDDGGG